MMASPAIQDQTKGILPIRHIRIGDIDAIDRALSRVLAADRVIERMSQVCPQGEDCAGPAENQHGCRVYECDECRFRACASCMEIHESEPHWSDADTARERWGRA